MIQYVMVFLFIFYMGCAQEGSTPISNTPRDDYNSPIISSDITVSSFNAEGKHKIETLKFTKASSNNPPVVFTNSLNRWKLDSKLPIDAEERRQFPFFLISVDDKDTPLSRLRVEYYFYSENEKPNDSKFSELSQCYRPFQWQIRVSETTVGKVITSFVGAKKFFLKVRVSDGINDPDISVIPFTIMNQPPQIDIKIGVSDLNIPYEVTEEEFKKDDHYLNLLQSRSPLSRPQVFKAIVLENKSEDSLRLKVEFDGFLENKVKKINEYWNEDQRISRPVGEELWSKADVECKVMGWRGNEVFSVNAQGKDIYELLPVSDTPQGLVILFLTQYHFIEFSSPVNESHTVRVDQLSIKAKKFKISTSLKDSDRYIESWIDLPLPSLELRAGSQVR